MNTPDFVIEEDTPPANHAGRGKKSELRLGIEGLKPGQVLRWRPAEAFNPRRIESTVAQIRQSMPRKTYSVRQVSGGTDIYCVEDMSAQ